MNVKFRTDIEAVVLATLAGGRKHGYGIVQSVRESAGSVLKLGEGQLYPILHRLEEHGWVSAEWEMQEGKPPKRVYTLTEEGTKELARRKGDWVKFNSAISSLLSSQEANGNA